MFLRPEWLLGLVSCLFVVWLHMCRRTTIVVPGIQLWKTIAPGTQPRSQLRPPKLNSELLTQLACVCAIFVALAEPVWTSDARALHRIFVVDLQRGPVVGAEARLSEALGHIRAHLVSRPASGRDRVSIIAASHDAHPVAARWSRSDQLEHRLSSLRAQDAAPDWPAVSRFVQGVLNDAEVAHVVVLTDRSPDAEILALRTDKTKIDFLSSRELPPASPVITDFTAEPVAGSRNWRVSGRLEGAAAPSQIVLSFQPQGAASFLDWSTASASASGSFSADITLSGAGLLRAAIPGSQAGAAFLSLRHSGTPLRIALLGEEDPAIGRALRAVDQAVVSSFQTLPANLAEFDLVVANNVVLPSHPGTSTLWIGTARARSTPEPVRVDAPDVTHWDSEHRISADLSWPLLKIPAALSFAARDGEQVLLASGSTRLITTRNSAAGFDVRIAFDPARSNWPQLASFPQFIARLVQDLNVPASAARACVVGSICKLERRLLGPQTRLVNPDDAEVDLPAVRFLKAAGADAWFPAGMRSDFVPVRAGLHKIINDGGVHFIPVNSAKLAGWSRSDLSEPVAGPQAVWRWIAIAAAVLLALEIARARLGAGSIFATGFISSRGPLRTRGRWIVALRLLAIGAIFLAVSGLPAPNLVSSGQKVLVGEQTGTEQVSGGLVTPGSPPSVHQDVDGSSVVAKPFVADAANLEEALRLANAMISAPKGEIIVGEQMAQSRGDAASALRNFHSRGSRILAVQEQPRTNDIEFRGIHAPARVRAGERFGLTLATYVREAREITLRLFRDGTELSGQQVRLPAGESRIDLVVGAASEGNALYAVEARDGSVTARDGLYVTILPPPRIAIVVPDAGREEAARVADALKVQSIESRIILARNAPWSLKDWLLYDGFVLVNLPAVDLDTRQQEMIETAVSRHGRGLLILGGPNAFGPGGYFGTPLERMSPLSARIPTEAPQAAMVFVLDRSGSMTQSVGDGNRLDIAKSATLSAIELLHEESDVSIVTFDSEAQAILPLQKKNMEAVRRALSPLTPGGGTSIHPGLIEAERQLTGNDSKIKHVVVMTDGLTQPGDFPGVIGRLRSVGATVSGLAIGSSADPATVQEIARLGGGSFHGTADFQALPGILAREAMSLSGEGVKERAAQPQWVERGAAFLSGLPESPWPVGGYVLTTSKPEAKLHLSIPETEGPPTPLLASWAYGSGQVLALATHGAGAWTADWQAREDFPLFLGQATRASTSGSHPLLQLAMTRHRDTIRVSLEALEPDGRPMKRDEVAVTIRNVPAGSTAGTESNLVLRNTAPALFAASILADRAGELFASVEIDGRKVDAALHIETPAVFRSNSRDPVLVRSLAAATGGTLMNRQEVLGRPVSWDIALGPNWRFWLLVGLGLFLADLVLRHAPGLLRLRR
jgi:Mg-chelatase subunit ChlD